MRLVLLGGQGQLGWELQRSLSLLGEVITLQRDGADGLCGDLSRPDAMATSVERLQPDVVVNAAAYTAVDRAETDEAAAHVVNAQSPQALARVCARRGAWLVHYSTDYVFDGSGQQPWLEGDTAAPLNAYGRTKWAGEQAVRDSDVRHLLLRTSWVYGVRGHNFASTMLRLARQRDQLRVVDDQIGAPTGADLLADATALALRSALASGGDRLSGTYHVAAAGETSWCGYARHVLQRAETQGLALRVRARDVQAIGSAEYPTPARRPLNSRLSCALFSRTFSLQLPDWRHGVERLVDEWVRRPELA